MNTNIALIAVVAAAVGAGLFFLLQTMNPETEDMGHIELILEAQLSDGLSSAQIDVAIDEIISVYENRLAEADLDGVRFEVGEPLQIIAQVPFDVDLFNLKPMLLRKGELSLHDVVEAGSVPNTILSPKSESEVMLKDAQDIPYLLLVEPFLSDNILTSATLISPENRGGFGSFRIEIKFTEQAAQTFADKIVSLAPDTPIAFVSDDMVLSAPKITESFQDFARDQGSIDTAVIDGNFNEDEVRQLVLLLNTAALPTDMILLSETIVMPDEGE